jgi:ribosomal protein L29
MKIKDLNGMGTKELEDKVTEARLDLMKLNAQVAAGTAPKSPGQIKATRKNIAKMKTIIKQKSNKNAKEEKKE